MVPYNVPSLQSICDALKYGLDSRIDDFPRYLENYQNRLVAPSRPLSPAKQNPNQKRQRETDSDTSSQSVEALTHVNQSAVDDTLQGAYGGELVTPTSQNQSKSRNLLYSTHILTLDTTIALAETDIDEFWSTVPIDDHLIDHTFDDIWNSSWDPFHAGATEDSATGG